MSLLLRSASVLALAAFEFVAHAQVHYDFSGVRSDGQVASSFTFVTDTYLTAIAEVPTTTRPSSANVIACSAIDGSLVAVHERLAERHMSDYFGL